MKWKWTKVSVAFVFCAASAWCSPRPQAAAQPKLVHDLRAIRKGLRVTLTWSQPSVGEANSPRPVAMVRICRGISAAEVPSTSSPCKQSVGEVDPSKATDALNPAQGGSTSVATLRYVDTIKEQDADAADLQSAVYTLELQDDRHHLLGVSNPAAVPLAPTLPTKALHFELDVRGVYLIWENDIDQDASPRLQFDYRVYRSEKGSAGRTAIHFLRSVVHMSDGDRWAAVDTALEWEKTYVYSVTPVTRIYSASGQPTGEVEGEDSPEVEVLTHDVFPPAVPENVLAVVSEIPDKKYVDLVWSPNMEKDLAGYNIYRRQEGGQLAKIGTASPAMLSFHDANVIKGGKYFYAISAFDRNGNESAKSQETTEVLP